MEVTNILSHLKSIADPSRLMYMNHYGINMDTSLGISIYELRRYAQEIGKNHDLALKLWQTGVHDAQLLACFIDEPERVTADQMDDWANDFNSWDLCDQTCTSLFDQNPISWKKISQWAESDKEYVKRAAFSLIAGLSVHDKNAGNHQFEAFFPLIKKHAIDERNYVKKAVNWSLRNIGKRNLYLNRKAILCANEVIDLDSRSAKWIGRDALRELESEKVQQRLKKKQQHR